MRTDLTFASETVNLPASHPDVKRYRVNTNVAHTLGSAQGQLVGSVAVSDIAMHMDSLPLQAESPTPGILPESDATAPATNTTNLRASASLSTAKDKPRPGPVKRKRPRQSLESMNAELNRQAAAAKKMSTFEKVCRDIFAVSTLSYHDKTIIVSLPCSLKWTGSSLPQRRLP
jgi:hypothetical protein